MSLINKLFQRVLVFAVMLAWIFSGWPQVWNLPPKVQEVWAITCGAAGFTDIGGGVCRGFITTTGAGTFTIPADWSDTNTIETIGGGGAGGLQAADASAGGGGGGYSTVSNLTGLSGDIDLSVGVGGTPSAVQADADGDDTWFNGTTCTGASICAGGGGGALDESPAGTGGVGGLGTADSGSNGGAGGTSGAAADDGGGGGGGAAGPGGAGGNGGTASNNGGAGGGGAGDATPDPGADSTTATGGAGGNGPNEDGGGVVPGGSGTAGTGGGGAGGTQTTTEDGGDGGTGSEWDSTHGAGGGGGGAADAGAGGNGGLYGGGGAGQGEDSAGTKMLGGQGLIVITYTAAAASAPTVTTNAATGVGVSSAVLNGEITATGGENATDRGFAWGTNSVLSGGDTSTTTESGSFGIGTFSQQLINLLSNKTYYFRAYATNSAGTGYGTILNFTTTADATVSRIMRLFEGFIIKLFSGRIILFGR